MSLVKVQCSENSFASITHHRIFGPVNRSITSKVDALWEKYLLFFLLELCYSCIILLFLVSFPGKAASVADMCITPSECLERLGDYDQYCPVSLADRGELVDCSVNSSLEFAAEFRGRYYKMASRVELELFLADPARYVPPLAPRKLPEPELLPKKRTAADVKTMFPKQIELKGYCPVTYLDGKLRLDFLGTCYKSRKGHA